MWNLTRRRLLTVGLGGGALLALGGGLRWIFSGYQLLPGEAAVGLSVKELCVVRSLVEMFFPVSGTLPSGVALGVHQRIDEEVWSQPPAMRDALRDALQLLEHAPPLFGFPGRLSALTVGERERCFQRLLTADADVVVQAAVALKQMAHLFYYGHPQVWRSIGYDGPWVSRPVPPESSTRYQALAARASLRSGEGA